MRLLAMPRQTYFVSRSPQPLELSVDQGVCAGVLQTFLGCLDGSWLLRRIRYTIPTACRFPKTCPSPPGCANQGMVVTQESPDLVLVLSNFTQKKLSDSCFSETLSRHANYGFYSHPEAPFPADLIRTRDMDGPWSAVVHRRQARK